MTTESKGSAVTAGGGPPVAFVTGASRGIGAATALALARVGVRPVLAVRDPAAAQPALDAVAGLGVEGRIVVCDVADRASVAAALATVLQAYGRLDAVINNAARIEPQAMLAESDPVEWAEAVTVNLVGAYQVVQAALPALIASRGTVVNLSSGAAHQPRKGWSAYCATKAGLVMLTRSLALEYGEHGVTAYGLAPGVVDTEMQVAIRAKRVNEISQIPRANLASPALSAEAIAWLVATRPAALSGRDLTMADVKAAQG